MLDLTLKNIEFIQDKVSKQRVLEKFAEMAMNNNCIISKEEFLEGLYERENEFSTGIGAKVAIPHCKSDTVKEASVFIQKLFYKVDWCSIDEEPVELAICLAIPQVEAETTHLKLLSSIARSLINKEFVKKLLKSEDKQELLNLIIQIINKK